MTGRSTQQPKLQAEPASHAGKPAPQRVSPSSQVMTGVPPPVPASPSPSPSPSPVPPSPSPSPSPGVEKHSAGRSSTVLPGHSSHVPQVLTQLSLGTQVLQPSTLLPSMLQPLP